MNDNQNDNMDRDWEFEVNLSGIQAPTGKGTKVPEGYYKVALSDMYRNPDKPNRVIIKALIAEGRFKGMVRTDGLSIPKSPEDNVRYYWRALAESVGYTPAQLDAGSVKLTPPSFIGKTGYIHYTPGNEQAPKGSPESYDSVVWLSKKNWEDQKVTFEGESTIPAAESTTTPEDVLKGLGL